MRVKTANIFDHSLVNPVLLAVLALFLASCRLEITTDETGYIVSASGAFDCDQDSCVMPIEGLFVETFTAVAADGYRFIGWNGICSHSVTIACDLQLIPLPDEFHEYDGDVQLSARFESTSVQRTWYRDKDQDNYGAPNKTKLAFEQPEGFVVNNLDCNDRRKRVHPGSKEKADGQDNNCDGRVDEGFAKTRYFRDLDGDGFGDSAERLRKFRPPVGYVENDLDCNDSSAADNPDAEEVVDQRDNDCDGIVDEGLSENYPDADGDGFGAATGLVESLEPLDGYVKNNSDCDDNNADIFPGASESFDSADNDCDGAIDEGFVPEEYYRDVDGDGFGDPSNSVLEVDIPTGFVADDSDNCVLVSNPDQSDIDYDGIGDACDLFTDTDDDSVQDSDDNCPEIYNPGQIDTDGDETGNACDALDDSVGSGEEGSGEEGSGEEGSGEEGSGEEGSGEEGSGEEGSGEEGSGEEGSGEEGSGEEGSGDVAGGCSITAEEQAMLDVVNVARAQARVCGSSGSFSAAGPLTWNCKLETTALGHSMDMANNDFFAHQGSNGNYVFQRATAAGYGWSAIGENLAAGVPLSSVSSVVQAWLGSPGHCANLMHPGFTELGAAKYSNPSSGYGLYWTQVFGSRF